MSEVKTIQPIAVLTGAEVHLVAKQTEASRANLPLEMYVIYDRPLDYPNHVVVRKFYITTMSVPSGMCTLHGSIAEARRSVPPCMVCMPRNPSAEPQIVETWF